MRSFLLISFFVSNLISGTYAQCNCAENFEFVYHKTKINYAGWKDKTSVDAEGFASFTEQQRQKAKEERQKNYCYKIIQTWLDYFQDGHTHLYNSAQPLNFDGKSEEQIREHFSGSESIPLSTLPPLRAMFDNHNKLEGLWDSEDGNYRIAIFKNKTSHRDFVAIVMQADSIYWTPGQVKMELEQKNPGVYSVMYYMRDHSLRMTSATLVGNTELRIKNFNSFYRAYPVLEEPKLKVLEEISKKTELRKLNASTLYFRLPTFNHQEKSIVDSLISVNHDLITETPNLILDVRNNGGGSDVTYGELIQYLYTNKITLTNNSIWSSEDNIQKFQSIIDDPRYPKSGKRYIGGLVKKLKSSPNTFVKKEDNVIRKMTVLKEPRQIVILINKGCASSCEEFVLAARQSKKVTLIGENTMGVLDYANVHQLPLPCAEWGLQYATSRTNRLPDFPIDNVGIPADVKISDQKNWVDFAVEYLKKQLMQAPGK